MSEKSNKNISYKYCLNCQTELHGKYCHVCGQHAMHQKPTVKEFILEYLNIAFIWDTHFFKTLWQLVRKPGHLTNEYVSGKFISYTHPLKLNMFLLFVFITLFLLFYSAEDVGNSLQNITRNEAVYPVIQLNMIQDDPEYSALVKSSRLDTVKLYAPLLLSERFADIIQNIDCADQSSSDSMAIWTASLPHQLIEDKAIIPHADGHYYFNTEFNKDMVGAEILEMIWKQMVKLTTTYFPLIIILTAPFLSLIVRLLHRKGNHSQFKHFVFSLHYTSVLELIIILLYIIHLVASPPTWLMQCIITAGSFIYLALAFRRVYETNRWLASIYKAIMTNLGYSIILLVLFMSIFFISCVIVSFQI